MGLSRLCPHVVSVPVAVSARCYYLRLDAMGQTLYSTTYWFTELRHDELYCRQLIQNFPDGVGEKGVFGFKIEKTANTHRPGHPHQETERSIVVAFFNSSGVCAT